MAQQWTGFSHKVNHAYKANQKYDTIIMEDGGIDKVSDRDRGYERTKWQIRCGKTTDNVWNWKQSTSNKHIHNKRVKTKSYNWCLWGAQLFFLLRTTIDSWIKALNLYSWLLNKRKSDVKALNDSTVFRRLE